MLAPSLPFRELGEGAFSVVFLGSLVRNRSREEVAVKIMRAGRCGGRFMTAREYEFARELANREHELLLSASDGSSNANVVTSFGVVRGVAERWRADLTRLGRLVELERPADGPDAGEMCALVMKYVDGCNLDEFLHGNEASGRVVFARKPLDCIRLLLQISVGLKRLHDNPTAAIVHGDLKPQNILIEAASGVIKLADFGLSDRRADATSRMSAAVARQTSGGGRGGGARGTWPYMAREIVLAEGSAVQAISRTSDIYALGTIMWEVLSGELPWDGFTEARHGVALAAGTMPLAVDVPPFPVGTPPAVVSLVGKCLSMDRKSRPSINDVFITLKEAEADLSSEAYHFFLSYSWGAEKRYLPFVDRLYFLLCEEGYRVWLDRSKMGHDTERSMRDGIAKSAVVLVLVSPEYAASDACMFELRTARDLNKPIIAALAYWESSCTAPPCRCAQTCRPKGWNEWMLPARGSVLPSGGASAEQIRAIPDDHPLATIARLGNISAQGSTPALRSNMYADLCEAAAVNWAPDNGMVVSTTDHKKLTHSPDAVSKILELARSVANVTPTKTGPIGIRSTQKATPQVHPIPRPGDSGALDPAVPSPRRSPGSAVEPLPPARRPSGNASAAPVPTRIEPPSFQSSSSFRAVPASISWSQLVPSDESPLQGSMGVVFRARWQPKRSVSIDVAVKLLKTAVLPQYNLADAMAALKAEAEVMSAANGGVYESPNVAKLFGVAGGVPTPFWRAALGGNIFSMLGADRELHGLVIRWEGGGSLNDLLHSPKRVWAAGTAARLRLCADIASGLAHLHGGDPCVLHGDVKPENVLLRDPVAHNATPAPVLTDFGLATLRNVITLEASRASSAYIAHEKRGTWPYMAPEMLEQENGSPAAGISRSTDVYALGTLCWEVLSGARPWEGFTEVKRVLTASKGESLPILSPPLPVDMPQAVRELLARCLGDRAGRPEAAVLAAALRQAAQDLTSGMFDVFLSHAWVNGKHAPLTTEVYSRLLEAGYRVWLDTMELGHDLAGSVLKGIASSRCVVALLSSRYEASHNCIRELQIAYGVLGESRRPVIACLAEVDMTWFPARDSAIVRAMGGRFDTLCPDLRRAAEVNWAPANGSEVPPSQRGLLTRSPNAMPLLLRLIEEVVRPENASVRIASPAAPSSRSASTSMACSYWWFLLLLALVVVAISLGAGLGLNT